MTAELPAADLDLTDAPAVPALDWTKSDAGARHAAEAWHGTYIAARCPRAGRFYVHHHPADGSRETRLGAGATLAVCKQRAEDHHAGVGDQPVPAAEPAAAGMGLVDRCVMDHNRRIDAGAVLIPVHVPDVDAHAADPFAGVELAPYYGPRAARLDPPANPPEWYASTPADTAQTLVACGADRGIAGMFLSELSKGRARRVRKALYGMGRRDLAGARRPARR